MPLRIGTRESLLARWQAEWVAARLRDQGQEVVLVLIRTRGDAQQVAPIGALGGQGVFTKEIQAALLDGQIDVAVHSLKDLPTDQVNGLCLAAVPERGPVRDALVCRQASSLGEIPEGTVVGTGSLRRRAQLLFHRPDLRVEGIRGNVDTRLRKLDEGQFDAIMLAEAGLTRLGLAARITERLPLDIMLPAVGQGALGIETRDSHEEALQAAAGLDHAQTHAAVVAERAMLAGLHGGCLAPIAAHGSMQATTLTLRGRVIHPNGEAMVEATFDARMDQAAALGQQVADALLAQGAADFIQQARGNQS
ncbi:MAG: hydroxymethylbilane synthase [Patescibacteria group bacterium]|nr:hydroxymethylbilane synthase [Patescibacteria group bacterium]